MAPPVQVSPVIKLCRYSALLLGLAYGKTRNEYLKPVAEKERKIAAIEQAKLDELLRLKKEAEDAAPSILQ
uniref:ATP synthase subunit e, mitochondrial n=1 Tax=Myxine glutinosa TaxID=7769 RepID=UPI00358E7DFD